MHPEQIKAEMRMKGVTPAMLCDELGLSRSMITHVIHGHARSKRVEERISQIIGKAISDIWATHKPRLRRVSLTKSSLSTQEVPA